MHRLRFSHECQNTVKVFEEKQVRTVWDDVRERWYFSVVELIAALTGNERPRKYWNDLKMKLRKEGSQLSEKIGQLKMRSSDGKLYVTDVADTDQLFRLIQSIPSPKAEPFKLWLAQIGSERLDEMHDPEITIDRALAQYLRFGYSQNWINQRLKSMRDNPSTGSGQRNEHRVDPEHAGGSVGKRHFASRRSAGS